MFKKMLVAGLAVAAAMFVLSSTHLGSYAKTAWKNVRKTANAQVPLEFQVETLRNEISALDPDMKNNIGKIAEETVAVQRLKEQLAETQVRLDKAKDLIRSVKEDLKKGETRLTSTGRTLSIERTRDRLALALNSAKRCEDELKSKENLLEAKERALEVAREQLSSMRSQREQLEVHVAQLEADLKTMRLVQTQSKFQFDDSRLATIKAQLADIKGQINIERTKGDLLGEFGLDTPQGEKKSLTSDQLIKEVEAYLGTEKETGVAKK